MVVAGDAGAAITPTGTQPLPADQLAEAMKEAFHDLSFLARVAGEVEAVAGRQRGGGGTPCDLPGRDLAGIGEPPLRGQGREGPASGATPETTRMTGAPGGASR